MLTAILLIIITLLITTIIIMWLRFKRSNKKNIDLVDHLNTRILNISKEFNKLTCESESIKRDTVWHSELFLQSQNMILAFIIIDEDVPGNIIAANNSVCESLEYTREELYNKSILDIEIVDETYLQQSFASKRKTPITLSNTLSLGSDSSTASRAMQLTIRRIIQEKSITYKSGYKTKSGKRIPVEIIAQLSSYDGKSAIICNTRDQLPMTELENALNESRQQYKDFISNAPFGIAVYTGTRHLTAVNSACLHMFGFPDKTEFINFNIFDNPFLPDNARRDIKKGNTTNFTIEVDFAQAIQKGLFISSLTRTGFYKITFNNMGHDKEYNARGFLITFEDITQQHETEVALRERETELHQARKMEAIGVLAGGVAHDFNNILTPILGYSQLGVDLCQEGDQLYQFMSEILSSSRRAKDLVGQILTFSRQTEGTSHPISVTPIVKEVIKQTAASLPDNIKISRVLKTEDDLVVATPTQLHQILMNLCTNAAHVVNKKEEGEIQVRLSSFVLGRHHRREFPQLVTRGYLLDEKRQRYLRISVKDNGIGIDEKTRKHIFEPFFTTKPSGEGTGMGLAVVQGIITSLDGAISLETEPGEGTVFHVVLPVVDAPHVNLMKEIPTETSGEYTILFVDDEVGIVKLAEHMLKTMGYNAVVTNQSTKALKFFKEDPQTYDIVITDQVMPELTGSELAKRILAINPDIPIILCTGFSESLTQEKAAEIGIQEIVMKPIEMAELSQAINRAVISIKKRK